MIKVEGSQRLSECLSAIAACGAPRRDVVARTATRRARAELGAHAAPGRTGPFIRLPVGRVQSAHPCHETPSAALAGFCTITFPKRGEGRCYFGSWAMTSSTITPASPAARPVAKTAWVIRSRIAAGLSSSASTK